LIDGTDVQLNSETLRALTIIDRNRTFDVAVLISDIRIPVFGNQIAAYL
jgi:hypothetical protein